jgi:hypothetical protein
MKKKTKKPRSTSTGGPGELGTWGLRLAAASRTDLTDDPLRRNAAFASLVRVPAAHCQEQGRGRQAAKFTAQQQLREPQEL